MNKEEAQSYVGKTVYTVNYSEKLIEPRKILDILEVYGHSDTVYQLRDETKELVWAFKDTLVQAQNSLVKYYQERSELAKLNLQEALKLVGLK